MTTKPTGKRKSKPRNYGLVAWFLRQTRAAKSVISIVGALGVMITAMLAVDSRYASAGDVNKLTRSIELSQLANEIAILNLRRSAVNDRVLNLSAKDRAMGGRFHPAERAQLQRDQAELHVLDKQIDDRMRLAREKSK